MSCETPSTLKAAGVSHDGRQAPKTGRRAPRKDPEREKKNEMGAGEGRKERNPAQGGLGGRSKPTSTTTTIQHMNGLAKIRLAKGQQDWPGSVLVWKSGYVDDDVQISALEMRRFEEK